MWMLLVVASCVESKSFRCGDKVCPVGQVCTPDRDRCVVVAQIEACANLPDLEPCSAAAVTSGICLSGVCLEPGCGNGKLEANETCEDSNTRSGDGCSADCQSNESCGNSIIEIGRAHV